MVRMRTYSVTDDSPRNDFLVAVASLPFIRLSVCLANLSRFLLFHASNRLDSDLRARTKMNGPEQTLYSHKS